jgi:hypothetical protein
MPEPGTRAYEEMIDFMRYDLEHDMALTKIVMAAKKVIEDSGRNFDEEFAKWTARRNAERRKLSKPESSPEDEIEYLRRRR